METFKENVAIVFTLIVLIPVACAVGLFVGVKTYSWLCGKFMPPDENA